MTTGRGLTFEPLEHVYRLDGRPVWRSVTGVLKAAGLIDFSAIPGPILDAARVRGTTVHQAIAYHNEGDLAVDHFRAAFPDYWPYVAAWLHFREARRFTPVLAEYRVASRRYDLAGTIDCLGILDGHAAILDFATGDPADVAKDLQTSGYLVLAREWAEEDPVLAAFVSAHPAIRRYGVALRNDETFAVSPYSDPADTRAFLTLVEAQRIVHARKPARAVAA
jgi:hypothetical protein